MEEVTFEPGLLGGDEGQSSCPHFLIFHSFLYLHPWQSGLWHHMEMLLARSSETFLWQIQWRHHGLPLNLCGGHLSLPPSLLLLPCLPCSPFSIFLLPSIYYPSVHLPSYHVFILSLYLSSYLSTHLSTIYLSLSMSLELRRVQ